MSNFNFQRWLVNKSPFFSSMMVIALFVFVFVGHQHIKENREGGQAVMANSNHDIQRVHEHNPLAIYSTTTNTDELVAFLNASLSEDQWVAELGAESRRMFEHFQGRPWDAYTFNKDKSEFQRGEDDKTLHKIVWIDPASPKMKQKYDFVAIFEWKRDLVDESLRFIGMNGVTRVITTSPPSLFLEGLERLGSVSSGSSEISSIPIPEGIFLYTIDFNLSGSQASNLNKTGPTAP